MAVGVARNVHRVDLAQVHFHEIAHWDTLADLTAAEQDEYCNAQQIQAGAEMYVVIFVLAQSLIGIGSTPILTVGLSYIDNHVARKKSPQYLGKC